LLKGANDTLIATMDHLAVANLLDGNQDGAANVSYADYLFVYHGVAGTQTNPVEITVGLR
jgi:hypothetical protein